MHLGVDGGGTSTRAVLVGIDGTCHGLGTGGGGNPVSWGPVAAMKEIERAVRAARRQAAERDAVLADPVASPIGHAVLALAGGTSFSSPGVLAPEMAALGITGAVTLSSDLLGTFCSGTASLEGYALVAGTGSAAIRVRGGSVETSADGLGWLLGDAGSGFWIGHKVARSALAGLEHRGPATSMTGPVLERLGLPPVDPDDERGLLTILRSAVETIYRWQPVELSALAPLAFTAAAEGDHLGGKILAGALDELIITLGSVIRPNLPGPVVLGGSVATRLPGLADAVGELMASRTGTAPVVAPVPDGTVGAAVLALRSAGVVVDDTVHARITETLATL